MVFWVLPLMELGVVYGMVVFMYRNEHVLASFVLCFSSPPPCSFGPFLSALLPFSKFLELESQFVWMSLFHLCLY